MFFQRASQFKKNPQKTWLCGSVLSPVIACLQTRTSVFAAVRAENWQCLTNLSLPLCLPHFSLADSDNNITMFHWLSLLCHFLSPFPFVFHHFLSCLSATDTLSLSPYHSPPASFLPYSRPYFFFSPLVIDSCPIASVMQQSPTICPFLPLPNPTPSLLLILLFLVRDIDSCHGALTWLLSFFPVTT